jgi:hypothetical protein
MMQIIAGRLMRGHIALETLEPSYRVRALVQMGISPETSRVFGFGAGERSQVVQLARRRRVIV